jgi:hypothetical protein
MQRSGVPLNPPAEIIEAELAHLTPEAQPASGESLWSVLLDILLETFGIRDLVRAKVVDLVAKNQSLKSLFDDLAEAVLHRDLALVALRTEQVLAFLFGPDMLYTIETALGRAALEEILGVIGAQFVPFIGWALLIASFIIAVAHNWDKLQNLK